MTKKKCFKALKLMIRSIRWIMIFFGALVVCSVCFGGDVHTLFGAFLLTTSIWAVEAYVS